MKEKISETRVLSKFRAGFTNIFIKQIIHRWPINKHNPILFLKIIKNQTNILYVIYTYVNMIVHRNTTILKRYVVIHKTQNLLNFEPLCK